MLGPRDISHSTSIYTIHPFPFPPLEMKIGIHDQFGEPKILLIFSPIANALLNNSNSLGKLDLATSRLLPFRVEPRLPRLTYNNALSLRSNTWGNYPRSSLYPRGPIGEISKRHS
ncbi:hypothetical protein CsSME_00000824 [Camellia sinensis var. sinensis]